MIELANDRFSAGIDPAAGGSLSWFRTVAGNEIFKNARAGSGGATDSACFPMVPFCNRVRDRHFGIVDGTVVLAPNTADGLRTAHGFGWRSEWAIAERSDAHAVIRHEYAGGAWPWAYVAGQTISIDAYGLTVVLSVRNLSASAMPAGLGLHPYFPLRDRIKLRVHAAESSVLDEHGFPAFDPDERSLLQAAANGELSPAVGNRYLAGAAGPITICDPKGGHIATLHSSQNCRHYALHLERDKSLFCVEPMTHPVGALNDYGTMGEASGLRTLEAGATLEIAMRCAVATFRS